MAKRQIKPKYFTMYNETLYGTTTSQKKHWLTLSYPPTLRLNPHFWVQMSFLNQIHCKPVINFVDNLSQLEFELNFELKVELTEQIEHGFQVSML